jgi:hypothetical protein
VAPRRRGEHRGRRPAGSAATARWQSRPPHVAAAAADLSGTTNPFALLPRQRAANFGFSGALAPSFDALLRARTNAATRKKIRKKAQALANFGSVRFERATAPCEVRRVLDAFFTGTNGLRCCPSVGCDRDELRDELLNGEIFYSLREAQVVIEQWRRHYNTIRNIQTNRANLAYGRLPSMWFATTQPPYGTLMPQERAPSTASCSATGSQPT